MVPAEMAPVYGTIAEALVSLSFLAVSDATLRRAAHRSETRGASTTLCRGGLANGCSVELMATRSPPDWAIWSARRCAATHRTHAQTATPGPDFALQHHLGGMSHVDMCERSGTPALVGARPEPLAALDRPRSGDDDGAAHVENASVAPTQGHDQGDSTDAHLPPRRRHLPVRRRGWVRAQAAEPWSAMTRMPRPSSVSAPPTNTDPPSTEGAFSHVTRPRPADLRLARWFRYR
jgi:hypothetical protein